MTHHDSIPDIERSVTERDEIEEGDTVMLTKRVTEDDITSLARATGDENPLHLDEQYARETRFGEPIAHGVLGMGMLSGAIAALPGCPILLKWGATTFERPIAPDTVYHAVVAVIEEDDEFDAEHSYNVGLRLRSKEGELYISASAKVLLDPEPDVDAPAWSEWD